VKKSLENSTVWLYPQASEITVNWPLTHMRERERETEKSERMIKECTKKNAAWMIVQKGFIIYRSFLYFLDGVLSGPLSSHSLVSSSVGLVDVSDLGNERVIGIRVCEHGAYRQKNL